MTGPPDPDDDPLPEWAQGPRTTLDPVPVLPVEETPTAPHRTIGAEVDRAFQDGRDAGCIGCYAEGQEDAIRALVDVFAETPGGVDEFAAAVVARVRAKLTAL